MATEMYKIETTFVLQVVIRNATHLFEEKAELRMSNLLNDMY